MEVLALLYSQHAYVIMMLKLQWCLFVAIVGFGDLEIGGVSLSFPCNAPL